MKSTSIAALVGFVLATCPSCLSEPDQQNLAELVGRAEGRRDAKIQEVASVRDYILRNARWDTDATMQARMITSADGSKRYEILNTNTDGMRRKILIRILEGEVQAAARKDRDGSVNANNYEFRPIPPDGSNRLNCRMVELVAKNRTKFTFDGRGCVDMTDMAMVRMEGRTAKSISWLVGRAYVVQEFRKVGDFWYSSTSHSSADVKFLGKMELLISYRDYAITPKVSGSARICQGSGCPQLETSQADRLPIH